MSKRKVHIVVSVDTAYLFNVYNGEDPAKQPSKDSNKPVVLAANDVKNAILLVDDSKMKRENFAGSLFASYIPSGASLCWSTVSESQNSDSTVVPYLVSYVKGIKIISRSKFKTEIRKVFVPSDTNPLEGTYQKKKTYQIEANTKPVFVESVENYGLKFSVYTRRRGVDPFLFGYFEIQPEIVGIPICAEN